MGGTSASGSLLLLALLSAGSTVAVAQAPRTWVDPPAEITATTPNPIPKPVPAPEEAAPPAQAAKPADPLPAQPAPPPQTAEQPPQTSPSAAAARPHKAPEENRQADRAEKAKHFAARYLETWSAPNDFALEATAEFYAPRVLFHGRTMSMTRLFKEKRRFARRWPERDYRARQNAMGAECNADGTLCKVHTVFDFEASNSARRRSSQGAGVLQLVVNFIGDKPVIVAEHSTLLNQERKRTLVLEDASNE